VPCALEFPEFTAVLPVWMQHRRHLSAAIHSHIKIDGSNPHADFMFTRRLLTSRVAGRPDACIAVAGAGCGAWTLLEPGQCQLLPPEFLRNCKCLATCTAQAGLTTEGLSAAVAGWHRLRRLDVSRNSALRAAAVEAVAANAPGLTTLDLGRGCSTAVTTACVQKMVFPSS